MSNISMISTPKARAKLAPSKHPLYVVIENGTSIGYQRRPKGGSWYARTRKDGLYLTEVIAAADDGVPADGEQIMTYQQAVAAALAWAEAKSAVEVAKPVKRDAWTIGDCLDHYFLAREAQGKNMDMARGRAKTMIRPHLGDKEAAAITASEIRAWMTMIAAQPPMARVMATGKAIYRKADMTDPEVIRKRRDTVNRLLTLLKAALNLCYRERKLPNDHEWRAVQPFRKVSRPKRHYVPMEHIPKLLTLLNATFPALHVLVRGALATGCRFGELAKLRVRHIHRDSGSLWLSEVKQGGEHNVTLTADGIAFFDAITTGRHGDDLIFKVKDRAWRKGDYYRPLRAALKEVGAPETGLHIMRHTYASHGIMSGVDKIALAKNLGHTDTRMIDVHYGHLSENWAANEIRSKMPNLGGGG